MHDDDSQAFMANNLIYEYISSSFSLSNVHSFWNGCYGVFILKYFNSSFSKNILYNPQYGSFMTIHVSETHSIKYLQNSNSSGLNSILSFESPNPATIMYVNLLYDQVSPILIGAQAFSSNNICDHFYVFGNKNISRVFATTISSSTITIISCTFDLPSSMFSTIATQYCLFSNSVNNFLVYTKKKLIICEEVIQIDRFFSINNCQYYYFNNLFISFYVLFDLT